MSLLLNETQQGPSQLFELAGNANDANGLEPGQTDIQDYYGQTIDDYETWSRDGYMHFGLWKKWINPFRRRQMLEAMNDMVFSELRLESPTRMLVADLGCGVGAVSRYGSHKFFANRWLAVTLSAAQIEHGKSMLDPLDEHRIRFLQADYSNLPIEDNSLDAAFFLESLCHADHPYQPLQEVARTLKPGARLVVVDGMMRKIAIDTPGYAGWIGRKTAESWAVGEFHSVPEFEEAVEMTGLAVERKLEIGWHIAPSVMHSPWLISTHALKLMLTGKMSPWKRKHLVGCGLGMLLGLLRRHFGYFAYTLVRQ